MSDEAPTSSPDGVSVEATKVEQGPRPVDWLLAALAVGLIGGMVAGLADAYNAARDHLEMVGVAIWLDTISFSVITHSAIDVVACLAACLAGVAAGGLSGWLRRRLRPGPLACAGLLLAEASLFGWFLIVIADAPVPRGPAGLLATAGVCAIALVPVGWIYLWLGRTFVGRGVAALTRIAVWPALLLLIAAIGLQWQSQPRLRSAEGFWPVPAAPTSTRPQDRRPNVVLVVFDTLRVDRLGCYGYDRDTSPYIDAFSDDAALFERAISPAPWTVPSHASMFTGLYGSQHMASTVGWLDDGFVTLAEALRDRGYQTLALSNNRLVSPATKLTQGFEQFVEPGQLGFAHTVAYRALRLGVYKDRALGPLLGRWFLHDAGGGRTASVVGRCLRRRDRARPFFLFINYMEPHAPYEPRGVYREAFVAPDDLDRSYRIDQSTVAAWLYSLAGKPIYDARDLKILSDLYDARVREMDGYFADLMRVLADEVNLDETVVILTSDHGENVGDHGMLGHTFAIHNTLVCVPLIVRWPGAMRPQRVTGLVQTHDIFPSVLAWTGARATQFKKVVVPPLAAALQPTSRNAERRGFSEYLLWSESVLQAVRRLDPQFDPARWRVAYRAIFDGPHKLVLGTGPRFELYDLAHDPGETRNQAVTDRATVKRLTQELTRWAGSLDKLDPKALTAPADPKLQRERRERLRDLGYLH